MLLAESLVGREDYIYSAQSLRIYLKIQIVSGKRREGERINMPVVRFEPCCCITIKSGAIL